MASSTYRLFVLNILYKCYIQFNVHQNVHAILTMDAGERYWLDDSAFFKLISLLAQSQQYLLVLTYSLLQAFLAPNNCIRAFLA